MPSNPNPLIEIQDDRISRLEDGQKDVAVELATLTERVNAGFTNIVTKLESILLPVAIKLENHIQDDKELLDRLSNSHEKLTSINSRLVPLEESAQKVKSRKAAWKKVWVAVGVALAGSVATIITNWIFG